MIFSHHDLLFLTRSNTFGTLFSTASRAAILVKSLIAGIFPSVSVILALTNPLVLSISLSVSSIFFSIPNLTYLILYLLKQPTTDYRPTEFPTQRALTAYHLPTVPLITYPQTYVKTEDQILNMLYILYFFKTLMILYILENFNTYLFPIITE